MSDIDNISPTIESVDDERSSNSPKPTSEVLSRLIESNQKQNVVAQSLKFAEEVNENTMSNWGVEETVADSYYSDPEEASPEYIIEEEVVMEDVEDFEDEENSTSPQNEDAEAPSTSLPEPTSNEIPKPDKFIQRRFIKNQTSPELLEPLPEGWWTMQHNCGIPFYFHKRTGAITWSRPYSVGPTFRGLKKHSVPVASIPCFQYLKIREEMEKKQDKAAEANGEKSVESVQQDGATVDSPFAKLNGEKEVKCPELTSSDATNQPAVLLGNSVNNILGEEELQEYLEKRFEFDSVEVPYFTNWSHKRAYSHKMKRLGFHKNRYKEDEEEDDRTPQKQFGSDKIVTVTVPRECVGDRPRKLSYNIAAKPMICILHEYVQLVLKAKPDYEFTTTSSSTEPYFVRLMINDKEYGNGAGASKKLCKNKAALKAMDALVPGFKEKVDKLSGKKSSDTADYFDDIAVDDIRIYDLCLNSGTYQPYELLTECLKRNQKIADVTSVFEVFPGRGKMLEYKLTCGKHVIHGSARSKKIGKQVAAQRMLQLLHPQAKTWGELTRLYGSSVAAKIKRKQEMEQEILELKQKSYINRPGSPEDGELLPQEDPTSSNVPSMRRNDQKRDVLAANPELLAKLKSMMMNLGKERGLLDVERRKRENEIAEEEESQKKRRKLLLIDI